MIDARLADRIWIVGPTGSGKSTLAKLLGETLDLPPTHLDDVYHQPGWTTLSPEAFHLQIDAITRGPRWIVDGNYGALRRLHMHKAELIVWLDLPLRVTLPRLVRRSIRRIAFREPCCNGNHESVARTFFSRESILWWALKTDGKRLATLPQEIEERALSCVRLDSRDAIRRWLAAVTGSHSSRAPDSCGSAPTEPRR